EVDEDGQVKVEGKTVEKVMVEGKDFFDGDTKLATKNIPANAVEKVQVLRNYNDVGPMQGVDTDDRIALNIKLKDGKKNLTFGDITAEGGLDERYLVHPNVFYYTPKGSINFIGDINNLGEPAFTFQDYFRFGGGFRGLGGRVGSNLRIANDDLGFALVANNRANEITSRLGALNFSYNPKNAWTFSGFAIGAQTLTQSASETMRTYLRGDQAETSEILTTNTTQQNNSGMFKLSGKYTPRASLHIGYDVLAKISEVDDDNDQISDFGVASNVLNTYNQQMPVSVNQNLEVFYEWNPKNIISLEAQHMFKEQDPFLLISSELPLFGTYFPITDTSQYQLGQNKLITTNKTDATLNHYYIFNKTNHINFAAGGSYTSQHLTSRIDQRFNDDVLQDFTNPDYTNNDVEFRLTDLYTSVHYKWKKGKFTTSPGLNLHFYNIEDVQEGSVNNRDYTFLLPDFFARYDFRKSQSLTFNYAMEVGFTDINNVAGGTIINTYNSLFTGNRFLDNSLNHNFTVRYFHFNMFDFTNVFAGGTYNRRADDITNGVIYQGLDRIAQPINSDNINDVASVFGGYGKKFTKWSAQFRTALSFTNTNNRIGTDANRNQSFIQNYTLILETNFKKIPNFELRYNFVSNRYSGSGVENTFNTHSPTLEMEAVFLKYFTFSADYTYNDYRNTNGSTASTYDFLNASLYFRKTKSPWELALKARNLLNTNIIRQDGFSDFLISTTQFYVLPRYLTVGVKYDL
ncbi:MAG: outer membrane beta-barrel protein, partial [Owenweeksia sp.]